MLIWFDTEFIEDGRTIQPISIGMVREDGAEYYAEFAFDEKAASAWVVDNVLPHLEGNPKSREAIAQEIAEFAGDAPEFWAYYADYDWVLLCQIYGPMIALPKGWPMYCRDLKQLADQLEVRFPAQVSAEHHALADARWVRDCHLGTFEQTNEAVED